MGPKPCEFEVVPLVAVEPKQLTVKEAQNLIRKRLEQKQPIPHHLWIQARVLSDQIPPSDEEAEKVKAESARKRKR